MITAISLKPGSVNQFSVRLSAAGIKHVQQPGWCGFTELAIKPRKISRNQEGGERKAEALRK